MNKNIEGPQSYPVVQKFDFKKSDEDKKKLKQLKKQLINPNFTFKWKYQF